MVLSILTPLVRIFVTKYWGKIADAKSWFLVDNRTVWVLAPIINIVGGIAWAGINISLFNIPFVMAPKEGRTMYLGASSAIGGLAGFGSTLIASMIIKNLKNFSVDFFGCHIGNMQIVFLLSGMILLITALYVHLFISHKKVYTQLVNA